MYWVYILHSKKDDDFYTGFTGNLEKRISEHNNGLVKSTRNRRPLALIYKEIFKTEKLAIKREKYLKGKGGIRIKQQLRNNIIRIDLGA